MLRQGYESTGPGDLRRQSVYGSELKLRSARNLLFIYVHTVPGGQYFLQEDLDLHACQEGAEAKMSAAAEA